MLANAEPWTTNGEPVLSNGSKFTDVRYLPETGSTNADLLAAARAGLPGPVVLVTGHQTAGRGRQDRDWFDEPGDSLLVSVLVTADRAWADLVPLATGLAAVDAVNRYVGRAAPTESPVTAEDTVAALKWPNDVLVPPLEERKLAGILIESTAGSEPSSLAVVIGMGLNLRWSSPPPADVSDRATTVEAILQHRAGVGLPDDCRSILLGGYLSALDRMLATLAGPDGRRVVVTAYRRRCLTVGRSVELVTPTELVSGRAAGIGEGGELLVETDDGTTRAVTAGDAHHRPVHD